MQGKEILKFMWVWEKSDFEQKKTLRHKNEKIVLFSPFSLKPTKCTLSSRTEHAQNRNLIIRLLSLWAGADFVVVGRQLSIEDLADNVVVGSLAHSARFD
jgi:hypothetical protein